VCAKTLSAARGRLTARPLEEDAVFFAGCVERDTLSEAAVSSRTVVTFVTWLIYRTEFSSSEL
jgi:hypothetical protein